MPKRRATSEEPSEPVVTGVGVEWPDEEVTFQKACAAWRKVERLQEQRQSQKIEFGSGPVCLVFVADLHLGSSGVNYPRVFDEAKIIAETPGIYLVLNGDLLDNFILAKMMDARHDAELTIPEEWALVRRYLKVIQHKLLVSVRGNHDRWTWALSGIDYFADVLKHIQARAAIYDTDDVSLTLRVGKTNIPTRIRHLWRYRSMWNLTHGPEQTFRMDGGNFRLAVGAHTHASGVCRGFNAGGAQGMAVLCGSYKVVDEHTRRWGFPTANGSTAQSVIIYPDGFMVGIERLDVAADLIRKLKP